MMMDEECDLKALIDIFDDEEELLSADLSIGATNFESLPIKETCASNKRRRSRLNDIFAVDNENDVSFKRRLRRASELLKMVGIFNEDEKKVIKESLLAKDMRFAQEFDQAQETGNWESIRRLVQKPRSLPHRRGSLTFLGLLEGDGKVKDISQDAFLGEDLSSVFENSDVFPPQSIPKKKGRPRKHGESKSKKISTLSNTNSVADKVKAKTLKIDAKKNGGGRKEVKEGLNKSSRHSPGPNALLQGHRNDSDTPIEAAKLLIKNLKPSTKKRPEDELATKQTMNKNGQLGCKGDTRNELGAPHQLSGFRTSAVRQTKLGSRNARLVNNPFASSANNKINKHFNKGRRLEGYTDESEKDAKFRKNERERRRRLMVSQGFSDLVTVLNMPDTAKLDKATVLNTAISRIQTLQRRIQELEGTINEEQKST